LNHIYINPSLNKNLTRYFTIGLGPKYESYKIEKPEGQSVLRDSLEFGNTSLYDLNQYVGLRGFLRLGAVDNQLNPSRGVILTAEANLNRQITNLKSSYSQYLSEFIFYLSPNIKRQLTFAGRIGGAMNYGDFAFYQANMLGGGNMLGIIQNLRGYRKTRFIGDKSFYQNAEVRLELLKFNFYLLPGKFGIIGLFDNGRVWAKGENSAKWHNGYGGGIWLNVFNKLILSGTYTISEEDALTNIRFGFFF